MTRSPVKKLALGGLLTALALILSYVESRIPAFFAVPGMKLGLTNIVVVFALYTYGAGFAGVINLMRILAAGFMFGNPVSIIYSLSGGVLSLIIMVLLKKYSRFGVEGVSVAGGVAHNAGQLIVAALVTESLNVFYYMCVLVISGSITGFLIGFTARNVLGRIPAELSDGGKRD